MTASSLPVLALTDLSAAAAYTICGSGGAGNFVRVTFRLSDSILNIHQVSTDWEFPLLRSDQLDQITYCWFGASYDVTPPDSPTQPVSTMYEDTWEYDDMLDTSAIATLSADLERLKRDCAHILESNHTMIRDISFSTAGSTSSLKYRRKPDVCSHINFFHY